MPLRYLKVPHDSHRRGQGVALPVTLVMLVVILGLGLGALRMTTTEERMTGYVFDRQLAFQAAEAGLREMEDSVLANKPEVGAACADLIGQNAFIRVCPPRAAASSPRWITLDPTDWGVATPVGPAGAQIQPSYLIEHLGSQFACANTGNSAQTCRQYRITVRAGGGQRAEVMLQSLYLTD